MTRWRTLPAHLRVAADRVGLPERLSIIVRLPLPVSTNGLYANLPAASSRKGRAKSKRYRAWIHEAGLALAIQRPGRVSGPVAVEILVRRPDARRRDVSNLIKAAEDLLVAHGVIADDSLVEDVRARWGQVEGAVVTVRKVIAAERAIEEAAE